MAPTAREILPMMHACRTLCGASYSGMERHELAELLLKLAEGRADLEQVLDELDDEQRGLRAENEQIKEAITAAHDGLGAGAGSDWQLFEGPRGVLGRWWEQAQQPARGSGALAEAVGAASPSELGKQLAEQWQQLGQQMASRFTSSAVFQVPWQAASATEATGERRDSQKPLQRVVLDQVYTSVSRRHLPGGVPDGQERACELSPKTTKSSPQGGITDALWAVTLHWRHFGAPDRAEPGPGSPKTCPSAAASLPEQASLLEIAEQPLQRLVLDEVYRSLSQRSQADARPPVPEAKVEKAPWEEDDDEEWPSLLAEDEIDESPRESASDRSPANLGQQFMDSWQSWGSWGQRVNEQFSGYVAQSTLGWESLRQALGEPDLQKKTKKAKKAKKEKAAQAEEDAGISFSRIVLKAEIRLGDGSIETLDIRTHEQCKEVASRFVKRHYLDSCLKRPLKAYLRNALNSATSLPVMLEVDLKDIEKLAAEE